MRVVVRLLSDFLSLDSLSNGVVAQSYQAVEYAFNSPVSNGTTRNTGTGNPHPSSSLDGILIPETGNGITFPADVGLDRTTVANFSGNGCIRVPSSVDVDQGPMQSRMISLDFKWDGTRSPGNRPQVLFEQGGNPYSGGSFNMYLQMSPNEDVAQLSMLLWRQDPGYATMIKSWTDRILTPHTWYQATFVLETTTETTGTMAGYLDDEEFNKRSIDVMLPIPSAALQDESCLGGKGGMTKTRNKVGKSTFYNSTSPGLYFHGQIDNFRIRIAGPAPTRRPVLEYTFEDKDDRYKNTGNGGSSSASRLDGTPKPSGNHGITFLGIGAEFSRSGCIKVPDDDNINGPSGGVGDRTISLDFKWGGSDSNLEPEILWEEGGSSQGMNVYLDPNKRREAELVMAVWENSGGRSAFVSTTIKANVWYHASMVLNRVGSSADGTLAGYLDSVKFGESDIDFFGIDQHGNDNCLGGMKGQTRVAFTDGTSERKSGDGLYFNGHIGKFRLANRVERPVVPTMSPSESPSTSPFPTEAPVSPTLSPSPSLSPTINPLLIVEYTFNDSTDPTKNTGDGDGSSPLDGVLVHEDHGIAFPANSDGDAAARFVGAGCIQIPNSDEINGIVEDRTIALAFSWDGTADSTDPQILFAEGTQSTGINMYLRSFQGSAELVMAVWETERGANERQSRFVVHTQIHADTWYRASLVLDRTMRSPNGFLEGYLNGVKFAEEAVDFFFIRPHSGANCLGGTTSTTFIVGTDDGSTGDGFYFHGLIDNFELYNSGQRPFPPPTAAPTMSKVPTRSPYPTADPTSLPSETPSSYPTSLPSETPTSYPTSMPSETPTSYPTRSPTVTPTGAPTLSPSLSNVPTLDPSSGPSSSVEPTSKPTDVPTDIPSGSPTRSPSSSLSPSIAPSSGPSSSVEPSIKPSSQPSLTLMPTAYPSDIASSTPSIGPSEGPSSTPSEKPALPGIWINITYDNFEIIDDIIFDESSGWGGFADGGTGPNDAVRITRSVNGEKDFIHQGTAALRIRGVPDGTGGVSSVYHANDHDVTGYSNLQVLFWYYARSMEQGKAFRLEYSSDSGSNWTLVREFVSGLDFEDDSFTYATVDFGSTGASYELTDQARIRFQCVGDARKDWIYIDEVSFQGFQVSAPAFSEVPTLVPSPSASPALSLYPTPVPAALSVEDPSPSWSIEPSSMSPSSFPTTPTATPAHVSSFAPSMASSATPTEMSNAARTWINITYDDFEIFDIFDESSGWGSFADGGTGAKDAVRITRSVNGEKDFIHQGTAALRIRGVPDGTGGVSSVYHANDHDVTGYSNLQVLFWYYARSMEQGKAFRLEYSSDSGSNWTLVKEYVSGQDFEDRSFNYATVDFDLTGVSYELSATARIRFLCVGNAFKDWIYIDEVLFQGFSI